MRYILLVIILIIAVLSAQEKMRIAVMDLQPTDVAPSMAAKISDLIRTELINTGKFTVIERGQMNSILQEQGFQQSGCTDESCAVEIGRMLAARKILVGTIMALGKTIVINGRIVDVETGEAEFGEQQAAANEESLLEACSMFGRKLAARLEGRVLKTGVAGAAPVKAARGTLAADRIKDRNRALITSVSSDGGIMDIGRNENVKKRYIYWLYVNNRSQRGKAEITEVNENDSIFKTYDMAVRKEYAGSDAVYLKYKGSRKIFNIGFLMGYGSIQEKSIGNSTDYAQFYGAPVSLYTKIGLGIKAIAGITSCSGNANDYESSRVTLNYNENVYIASNSTYTVVSKTTNVAITYNCEYETKFYGPMCLSFSPRITQLKAITPYIGVGAAFVQKTWKKTANSFSYESYNTTTGNLETIKYLAPESTGGKNGVVAAVIGGLDFLRQRRFTPNLSATFFIPNSSLGLGLGFTINFGIFINF